MQNRPIRTSVRLVALLIATVFSLGLLLTDANAQTRKKRSRRTTKPVVTNPTIAAPGDEVSSDEAKIISTADESAEGEQQESTTTTGSSRKSAAKKPPTDQERMQQTITTLSNQVERLSDKLTEMQESDKTLLDMERLTRAEQRAENLRTQLIDVETKLADLQGRLEQIDYSLRPENIERAAAGYGTLRPEELRESRRRQLENEKTRLLAQIRILETSKLRLETSLVTADNEVDRLRAKLEMRDQLDAAAARETESTQPPARKPPE
jgi:hypothetical protein